MAVEKYDREVDLTGMKVCAKSVSYTIASNGQLSNVKFNGGCQGFATAVANLLQGENASKAFCLLGGIKCGNKTTSCADQLAKALKDDIDNLVD